MCEEKTKLGERRHRFLKTRANFFEGAELQIDFKLFRDNLKTVTRQKTSSVFQYVVKNFWEVHEPFATVAMPLA